MVSQLKMAYTSEEKRAQALIRDIKHQLQSKAANLRCKELEEMLVDLGFLVRAAASAGHKIVHHPHIDGFYGTNYTCGHGSNPIVKPKYPGIIRKVINELEQELIEYVSKQQK